jgi:hypothetical protein
MVPPGNRKRFSLGGYVPWLRGQDDHGLKLWRLIVTI